MKIKLQYRLHSPWIFASVFLFAFLLSATLQAQENPAPQTNSDKYKDDVAYPTFKPVHWGFVDSVAATALGFTAAITPLAIAHMAGYQEGDKALMASLGLITMPMMLHGYGKWRNQSGDLAAAIYGGLAGGTMGLLVSPFIIDEIKPDENVNVIAFSVLIPATIGAAIAFSKSLRPEISSNYLANKTHRSKTHAVQLSFPSITQLPEKEGCRPWCLSFLNGVF
jgi:hypothetical protein